MGGKTPGPEVKSSTPLDAGTLCRAMSPFPGPVCGSTSVQKINLKNGLDTDQDQSSGSFNNEVVKTRIEVRLVGHASPRYKSAKTPAQADDLNLALSKQRTTAVRLMVEDSFRRALPGQELVFEHNVEYQSPRDAKGNLQIDTDSRGSSDTLKEAEGDRSSDAAHLRRVDVYTRLTFMIDGEAPSTKTDLVRISELTRRWAVKIAISGNVHITAGGAYMYLKLKNRETGTVTTGHVAAVGGGASAKWSPFGVAGNWGDYVKFRTNKAMDHNDFNGKGVRLTSLGFSLGIGYEWTYFTIYGVGSGAHSMSIGGGSWGTAGAGGFVDHGNIWVNTPKPRYKRVDRVEWSKYSHDLKRDDGHVINFGNNQAAPTPQEKTMLDQFVRRIAADYRHD